LSTISTTSQPDPRDSANISIPLHRRFWGWLYYGVPNLLVFSLLGSVLFFGHHTGWKMPKLSELRGTSVVASDDWCSEHLVPESVCIECNTDLLPKSKEFGFCTKHGVNECVTCHPELAQSTGEAKLPAYDTAKAIEVMARPENNSRDALHKRRIQFATIESADKSGIDIDVAQERRMSDAISANGQIMFDPTRLAHLSSRAAGTVAAVFKTTGDEVQRGDILALVDATVVGQAKSQLLQAVVQVRLKRSNVERLQTAGSGVPARALIEAESALQEAEIALLSGHQALVNLGFEVPDELEKRDAKSIAEELRLLGIPAQLAASSGSVARTTNLIPVRAPYEGVIVASDVVVGEVVDATKLLFTVADPSRVLLTLNVRQEDGKYMKPYLPVVFHPDDGSPDVTGRIAWVSPAIDEHTRTLQVRAKLDDSTSRLRDKTFGTGRIVLRDEPNAIVVPIEAVQSTSDATFIFVRDRNFLKEGSPKAFHVRQVRLGARDDKYVELLGGVLPGEVIATKGSPVLLAQLLRSNLGAGCGCHDH
jgi:cobalt-zinc-cadmium efflux system membrane fusion protein